MALAQRLAIRRGDKRMTQHQLAEAAQIAASTIARIERGGYYPQMATLGKLAAALESTVESLVTDEELARARAQRSQAISAGKRIAA
jgi:transcriptional regulator with XRE-family HTH domain